MFQARNFYWLTLASFILLIITIGTTSFYQFASNALYYAQSLPVYYWAGISVTIVAILISYKTKVNNGFKIIPHLLLAIYLFSLPSFTYENPRVMDVYFHGSGGLSIVRSGSIDGHPYARDYPLSFVLMATNLLITDIDPSIFLKVFQAFFPPLMVLLVYFFAKSFDQRYALYAPLAFNALFFQDQGHFSPQALALPLYMILWTCMVKLWLNKDMTRRTITVAIITLVTINMSNPTTSYFLFTNLISVALLTILVFRLFLKKHLEKNIRVFSTQNRSGQYSQSTSRKAVNQSIRKKIFPILLLHVIVLLSWSVYSAESRGMERVVEKLSADLDRFVDSSYAVPLSPDSSYVTVIITTGIATAFILLSSAVFLAFLFKYRDKADMKVLAIISAMIVGSIVVLPLGAFQSGTFFQRGIMYTVIPWSVLFACFVATDIKNKLYITTRTLALILVIIFVVLIPVTKYGSEPTTYASSSEIYVADFLTRNTSDHVVMTLRTAEFLFKYFGEYNDHDVRTARIASKNVIDQQLIENTLDEKIQKRDLDVIALTNVENNIYSLKYPSDQTIYIDYLQKRLNLVANSGTQVYTTPRE